MEHENEGKSTTELEITDEMIEAGVDAFCRFSLDDAYEDIVIEIYRAMASRSARRNISSKE
jgi:hypothetical protein